MLELQEFAQDLSSKHVKQGSGSPKGSGVRRAGLWLGHYCNYSLGKRALANQVM